MTMNMTCLFIYFYLIISSLVCVCVLIFTLSPFCLLSLAVLFYLLCISLFINPSRLSISFIVASKMLWRCAQAAAFSCVNNCDLLTDSNVSGENHLSLNYTRSLSQFVLSTRSRSFPLLHSHGLYWNSPNTSFSKGYMKDEIMGSKGRGYFLLP